MIGLEGDLAGKDDLGEGSALEKFERLGDGDFVVGLVRTDGKASRNGGVGAIPALGA